MQEFDKLAIAMETKKQVLSYNLQVNTTRLPNIFSVTIFDSVPTNEKFGNIKKAPNEVYKRGETVSVEFWAGSPKNNLVKAHI